MKTIAFAVAAFALLVSSSFAQVSAPGGGNCLFPLACPGPVPPKPEPLLGPPEDQAASAALAEPAPKIKHHARRQAKKTKSE